MNNPYDFYSNNGLHRTFNNHGLKSVARGYAIPDPDLGIGYAEYTGNISPVNYAPQPTHINVHAESKDVRDLFTTIGAGGLNIDSFPVDTYYGEPLGAI